MTRAGGAAVFRCDPGASGGKQPCEARHRLAAVVSSEKTFPGWHDLLLETNGDAFTSGLLTGIETWRLGPRREWSRFRRRGFSPVNPLGFPKPLTEESAVTILRRYEASSSRFRSRSPVHEPAKIIVIGRTCPESADQLKERMKYIMIQFPSLSETTNSGTTTSGLLGRPITTREIYPNLEVIRSSAGPRLWDAGSLLPTFYRDLLSGTAAAKCRCLDSYPRLQEWNVSPSLICKTEASMALYAHNPDIRRRRASQQAERLVDYVVGCHVNEPSLSQLHRSFYCLNLCRQKGFTTTGILLAQFILGGNPQRDQAPVTPVRCKIGIIRLYPFCGEAQTP